MGDTNKNKTNVNTELGLGGAVLLAIIVLGLWIAGLVGWISWPVVNYILKDALGYVLMGAIAATLVRLWKRAKSPISKVLLSLVGLVTWGMVVWFMPENPGMHFFEIFFHALTSATATCTGVLCATPKRFADHPLESDEGGRVTRRLVAVLEKPATKGFLIAGGSLMVFIALWIYTQNIYLADPYLLPGVAAFGAGSVLHGVEMWIAPRFPRFAKGLSIVSTGLIIAGFYFSARSFFYE